MFTKALIKDKEYNIVTQQYITSTYIIINNDPQLQDGSRLKERDYHIKIRKKILKNNDKLIDGTIIKYKGKAKINTFNI